MEEKGMTVRQKIIRLLESGPASSREISQAVGISEKDVPFHLASVEKSLRSLNRKVKITPSRCRTCGFVFTKGNRFKKPGRCPGCRDGRISSPLFHIHPGNADSRTY